MDEKLIRGYHRDCMAKLKRFIDEAGKMCDLLTKIEEFPISQAEQLDLLIGRRKEDVALFAYQEAQRKFFEAAISAQPGQT
jgi:hypothetical protein